MRDFVRIVLLRWYWFVLGFFLPIFVFAVMKYRGFPGVLEVDRIAGVALAVIATIDLGVMIPITCIVWRYENAGFNFFCASLSLLGISLSVGVVLIYCGEYWSAFAYLLGSNIPLYALYKLTFILHHKIERTKPSDKKEH